MIENQTITRNDGSHLPSIPDAKKRPGEPSCWWREKHLWLILLLVSGIYLIRLDYVPAVREEVRWARGAVQMLETGDWIVPRQQLKVFPERPPMSSWAMAVVGWLRGDVDAIAARLPSAIAMILTAVLVYGYGRLHMPALGAATAAIAYATFGQVLQIGRHGESEALFTLFLAGSLLLFHWGYVRKWSAVATWTVAYICMALAALVKGPQAPVYFAAVIGAFLVLMQRDWKFLLRPAHAIGLAVGLAIIAAWQIPYYLMTDWDAVCATWGGLAGDRFRLHGFLKHVVKFPLETFGCLLPWSPLLLAMFRRRVRVAIGSCGTMVPFLCVALLVTYPSIWFATGARGRYFMPLYPCIALLIGLTVEKLLAEFQTNTRHAFRPGKHGWSDFLVGLSIFVTLGGVAVFGVSLGMGNDVASLSAARQPPGFAVAFLLISILTSIVMLFAATRPSPRNAFVAVISIGCFLGVFYDGLVMNLQKKRWGNPSAAIAKVREQIPDDEKLISFGSIDHRFCYYFRDLVTEHDWPMSMNEVPTELDYFFMSYNPLDTPLARTTGRGRDWSKTYGTLPFEWEEVARVVVDRSPDKNDRQVMLARVKRDADGRIAIRQNMPPVDETLLR